MLKFSKWKLVSIVIIILLSIYFSIPTFFYNFKTINFIPKEKINFGLDLKGGVSLTIQANLTDYIKEKFLQNSNQIKSKLISNDINFSNWQISNDVLKFIISKDNGEIKKAKKLLPTQDFYIQNSANQFSLKFNNDYIQKLNSDVLKQSIEVIRKRVDSVGTKEIEIQTVGDDKILLQVPGISNPDEIKQIIGKTARLSFHMVKDKATDNLTDSEKIALLINSKILPLENGNGSLIIETQPLMTGDMLETAFISQGTLGEPVIRFKLDNLGREIFADITTNNTGKNVSYCI